jgi:hypothetical protein
LSRWPLFGVWIGGKDVIYEYASASFYDADAAMGNNAFAEIGTYLGIIGGVWFLVVLVRRMRLTGVQRLGLIVLIVVMFSQLMGGIITFRYWGYVALLWGALAVADAGDNAAETIPGMPDVNHA